MIFFNISCLVLDTLHGFQFHKLWIGLLCLYQIEAAVIGTHQRLHGSNIVSKIVGGTPVSDNKYPWIVAVYTRFTDDPKSLNCTTLDLVTPWSNFFLSFSFIFFGYRY